MARGSRSGCPTCCSRSGFPSTIRSCSPRRCATSAVPIRSWCSCRRTGNRRQPPPALLPRAPEPVTEEAFQRAECHGRPQPALHVRHVHRRTVEPVRARRLPCGRRSPVAVLQPAVHLRWCGSRQDALDARDRPVRAAAPSRLQTDLHLVRTIHERDDQRGALRPHPRFSRALSHASMCCSSTTFNSSPARRERRTSSSTPSMRCTTRRSRSSSAAIGRRTKSPRSRSVSARDSSGD